MRYPFSLGIDSFYLKLRPGGSNMSYKINEAMIPFGTSHHLCEDKVDFYLSEYRKFLLQDFKREAHKEICSGLNRMKRGKLWCCQSVDLKVSVGDLVFIEYGQAFLNEAGFQHFGLVMQIWNRKAFVIPMTSNPNTAKTAVNVSPTGKTHLYYIGCVKGLHADSTLFLNDAKMINTSRVISINGHIDPSSLMFQEIQAHLQNGLF